MKQHIRALLDSIANSLSENQAGSGPLEWVRNLPGGDINYAAHVRGGNKNWFLKYHTNAPRGMFDGEAKALAEIVDKDCIKAPRPITSGRHGNIDWLVLEFIELSSIGSAAQLGEELAALHTVTGSQYGWKQDNYIGTTPQLNTRCNDWSQFWRDYRLKPQLEMAHKDGHAGRLFDLGEQLLENMDQIMEGHQPAASLLHGDLWAGNKAYTTDGRPVVFDPAIYYGDRETDIAMTELFGGFSQDFYTAYQAHFPLPEGYKHRRDLYNLYHMLNHLNLFGRGYLSRCENMVERVLTKIN